MNDPWAAFPDAPRSPAPPPALPKATGGGDIWDAFPDAPAPPKPMARGYDDVDLEPGERPLTVHRDPNRDLAASGIYETPAGPPMPPSQGQSAVRGIRQGATLNLADELAGLAAASPIPGAQAPDGTPQSFNPIDAILGGGRLLAEKIAPGTFGHGGGDAYDAAVAREREANEQARQANPGSYLAGELGGGLASAIATPAVAPMRAGIEAGMLTRSAAPIVNATLTGGVYGGIAGAGAGEGGIADRIPAAISGAGIGAGAGGLLGTAGQVVGKPLGVVADHVSAWRNPQAIADRVVARNVARDGADLPAIAQRMEDAAATNPASPLTLADAAGQDTRGLAGVIARTPGEGRTKARQFLEDRHVGSEAEFSQGERIIDRIGRVLGDRGSIAAADDIIAKRAAQAEPAYKEAFKRQIEYRSPAGKALRAMLDRIPSDARAYANRIMRAEDSNGYQLAWHNIPGVRANVPTAVEALPTARHWDYVKRGLDTAIDTRRDSITGRLDTYGASLNGLRTELLTALDKANPALALARRIYAGHSELLDALRQGKDVWRLGITAEAIAKDMKALTPGEQEMFRLGAANGLREKVANAGDGIDKVRLVWGTPALRAKMELIAPDPKSKTALKQFLTDESAMAATRQRATGGFPTAERLAEDAGMNHDLTEGVHALKNAAHGNVVGLVTQAARHLSKLNPERRGAVLDEARQIILNPDPQAVRAFAARMAKLPIDKADMNSFRGAVLKAASQTASGNVSRQR